MVVRSTVDPNSLRPALEKAVHDIDPGIVLYQMQTMEDLIAQSPAAALHRYPAWPISVFALTALLLAVVGLYGIVSHWVSQRTRSVWHWAPLAAACSSSFCAMVRLAAIGIGAGVIAAVLAGYVLRSLLFGIAPWDPATLLIVTAILSGVGLFASYMPARRAARLDPMKSLHRE